MERILVQSFERRIKETWSKSHDKRTKLSGFLPQVAVDSRNAVVVVVEGRQLNETSTLVMF